jgi:hypothetical protein
MCDREGTDVRALLRTAFRQPLLPAALSFPLLGFAPDAGLLIVPTALEFSEQTFTGQLFLGDLERLLDVVVENFDFHSGRPSAPLFT